VKHALTPFAVAVTGAVILTLAIVYPSALLSITGIVVMSAGLVSQWLGHERPSCRHVQRSRSNVLYSASPLGAGATGRATSISLGSSSRRRRWAYSGGRPIDLPGLSGAPVTTDTPDQP